jgi:hypothetical protein
MGTSDQMRPTLYFRERNESSHVSGLGDVKDQNSEKNAGPRERLLVVRSPIVVVKLEISKWRALWHRHIQSRSTFGSVLKHMVSEKRTHLQPAAARRTVRLHSNHEASLEQLPTPMRDFAPPLPPAAQLSDCHGRRMYRCNVANSPVAQANRIKMNV